MKRKALALSLILALIFSTLAGTLLVNLVTANPSYVDVEKVLPAPEWAESPALEISFPKNNSLQRTSCVSFGLNITYPKSSNRLWMPYPPKYKASWAENEGEVAQNRSAPYNYYIDMIPEGSHKLTITVTSQYSLSSRQQGYATLYTVYELSASATVYFTVDAPPRIYVTSIETKSYNTSKIALNYTVDQPTSKATYSFDGRNNVTISGNTTLSDLPNGFHNVTVYAWDEAGNVGVSETRYFSVYVPFPTALVAVVSVVSVVLVGIGLLVYFKKRKHKGE